MYVSTRDEAAAIRRPEARPQPAAADVARPRVARNVVLLGLTSMFTDISSEMVLATLPLYLSGVLGFTPLQFGSFDGAYRAVAALVALFAAVRADRRGRAKRVASSGYALSTVAGFGLVLAGGAWAAVVSMLYLDRLGKGIRTAPRDSLIAASTQPAHLARAFGVHRAFDTVGAIAGPALAAALLVPSAGDERGVFVVAALVGVVGLAVIVLLVDGRPERTPELLATPRCEERDALSQDLEKGRVRSRSAVVGVLHEPTFRRVVGIGAVLALLVPGDAIVYLAFQRSSDLPLASFPLLFSAAAAVFLLLAVPFGRWADRAGRGFVLVAGHALLVLVLVVLALPFRSPAALAVLVVALGASYAATNGVLVAMATAVLPASRRATGLAVLVGVLAVAHLVGSALYGALWSAFGVHVAAAIVAVLLAGVIAAVAPRAVAA